ncbi:MAG: hypothetical protein IPL59_26925 [Candidatus Competibacteraceae bacterium]|nr:hypothetical protein [Candidatus Competibacteraceae bacterium]
MLELTIKPRCPARRLDGFASKSKIKQPAALWTTECMVVWSEITPSDANIPPATQPEIKGAFSSAHGLRFHMQDQTSEIITGITTAPPVRRQRHNTLNRTLYQGDSLGGIIKKWDNSAKILLENPPISTSKSLFRGCLFFAAIFLKLSA